MFKLLLIGSHNNLPNNLQSNLSELTQILDKIFG